jgi:hypothetical protein
MYSVVVFFRSATFLAVVCVIMPIPSLAEGQPVLLVSVHARHEIQRLQPKGSQSIVSPYAELYQMVHMLDGLHITELYNAACIKRNVSTLSIRHFATTKVSDEGVYEFYDSTIVNKLNPNQSRCNFRA